MLVVAGDGSWSVGTSLSNAVKVRYGDIASIDDSTFGWSAVAAESNGSGGYRLWVRNDDDEDMIVEVAVDGTGRVDAASLAVLQAAQMYAVEEQYKIDLNDSGGFGSGSVLLQGGAVNLYMNELGHYQLGASLTDLHTLTVGGQPLDDQLLPAGWEIVEAVTKSGGGWEVFAQAPNGAIFDASFDGSGAYTGGSLLDAAAVDGKEQALGVDIDGDNDLAAPAGWTSIIQTPALRSLIDGALASTTALSDRLMPLSEQPQATPANTITYAELVNMMQTMIQQHKDNNNAPITAQEVADLQALAARGKAAFAGDGPAADYLAYVFGKLVEGSDANRFFTGGATQRSELGSLGAGASVQVLERLVAKWLTGGDMPSPSTAGDSATGAPKSVVAAYAQSTGSLFVDGITVTDVNQGTAGDCYLIAAMGGLAQNRGAQLQSMFIENAAVNGVRSWGVRFFDANGAAHWVTVNDQLPVTAAGATSLAYAGSANKDLNGEIWVPLLEKAYAQANSLGILPRAEQTGQNSFAGIEGGQGDPLGALIAAKVISYSAPGTNFGNNGYITLRPFDRNDPAARAQVENDLKAAINAGKTVWLGVNDTLRDSFGNQVLVGSHAHFLLDPDPANPNNADVLVYNPWGQSPPSNPPGPLQTQFVSPATMTLAQLIGINGLDFMMLDGPTG
ncbi:MAG: C2 family cysteine protease [Rubrivivax sp.]